MTRSSADASLVRFSCRSTLSDRLTPEETLDFVRRAWRHNVRNRITGELRVTHGLCEQTIEGPCHVVLPLAARVLSDPRHRDVAVDAFCAVEERSFSDWRCLGIDPAPAARVAIGAASNHNVAALRIESRAETHTRLEMNGEQRGASL